MYRGGIVPRPGALTSMYLPKKWKMATIEGLATFKDFKSNFRTFKVKKCGKKKGSGMV